MDYYKIGQQIRKYRKAQGISQEQLAERVDISTTHMSHIETGNTKLSLQVFIDIARALEVQTDDLLRDNPELARIPYGELVDIMESCTEQQARIVIDVAKATKIALEKYSN